MLKTPICSKPLVLLGRAALLVLLFLLVVNFAIAEDKPALRVACNLPLTGALATYGDAIRVGVEFARSENPEMAKRISYDWADNRSNAVSTVSTFREQLHKGPDIYVSGVRPQTMTIWDDVGKNNLPHFVWIFDSSVKRQGQSNFRMWTNFKVEPPLFVNYAKARRAKRIAVIYVQLPHTDEEYQQVIVPGLKNVADEVLVEAYSFDRSDFRDIATKVKGFAPDLLVLSGFQEQLVSMIKSLNTFQLLKEGNAVATYDLLDAATILKPEDVEGIRVSIPSFMLNDENSTYGKWKKRFIEQNKRPPLYTHAYAYDMALVINDAALRAGKNEDLLTRLRDTNIEGITGVLKFDEGGDLEIKVELGVFRNGVPVRDAGLRPLT